MAGRDELHYPVDGRGFLEPFLPHGAKLADAGLPWVTLTFATSLDSSLSIAPGVQTALSGPESKAMTHYLRSKHDAILIGVGTAVADDPSLNCRLSGVGGYGGEGLDGQPRPVVIDPHGRWALGLETKVLSLARNDRGRAPWIVTMTEPDLETRQMLEEVGGDFIVIKEHSSDGQLPWKTIFHALKFKGMSSIMVEGGGSVINSLLSPDNASMVDSAIITIAPTWLGQGGVVVSPARPADRYSLPVARLRKTMWHQLGDDCVLCGNIV